jgi:hypothetical protein
MGQQGRDNPLHRRLGAVALVSPALIATAFAFWLDLGPRAPLDPVCGISDATGLGSLVLFLLPGAVVAAWGRWSQKPLGTIAVLVAGTLFVTAVGFFFAWLVWFGKHHCGE